MPCVHSSPSATGRQEGISPPAAFPAALLGSGQHEDIGRPSLFLHCSAAKAEGSWAAASPGRVEQDLATLVCVQESRQGRTALLPHKAGQQPQPALQGWVSSLRHLMHALSQQKVLLLPTRKLPSGSGHASCLPRGIPAEEELLQAQDCSWFPKFLGVKNAQTGKNKLL